ncbi:MAG: oligosaccharide flippase family protein [Bacteroidota bacterium]|nr:oligosaccharide flippase family protein [Bacteroidota bacterium]
MESVFSKFLTANKSISAEFKPIISNLFSLIVLQGSNYVLPLLTLPYLVRVLGPEKFGLISFAQALVGYFVIVTDYGFNLSATKEISINKADQEKVSRIFSSVILLKVLMLCISFIIFSVIVLFLESSPSDRSIYFFSFGMVVGQVIFPTWFFQGMEKMKYITLINIFSKLIFTVLIFLFVKSAADYHYVPVVTSLGFILGGITSLIISFKNFGIRFILPTIKDLVQQLRDGFSIFVTSLSSNVISSSGIFILGLFQSREVVGYYSAIEKLGKAFVSVFYPITQAIFPHVSIQFAKSKEAGKTIVLKIGKYTMLLALFVVLVMAIFYKEIVALVYNLQFVNYSYLLIYFGIWLFFGVLNNFIGIQFLVGSGNSAVYSRAFAIASATTLTIFIFLTQQYSYKAIVGGILSGEVILTFVMMRFIYKLKLTK